MDLPIETLMQMSGSMQQGSPSASAAAASAASNVDRSGARVDAYDNGWDGFASDADNVPVSAPSASKPAAQEARNDPGAAAPVPDLSRFQRLQRGGGGHGGA